MTCIAELDDIVTFFFLLKWLFFCFVFFIFPFVWVVPGGAAAEFAFRLTNHLAILFELSYKWIVWILIWRNQLYGSKNDFA